MNPKPLLTAVALAAVAVATAISLRALANDKPAASAPPRPALTVTAVQPQSAQWQQSVRANGSIAAWQEASVGAETNGWRIGCVTCGISAGGSRWRPTCAKGCSNWEWSLAKRWFSAGNDGSPRWRITRASPATGACPMTGRSFAGCGTG